MRIEGAFKLAATGIYGLSEVIGPGVAQTCAETKDGLHLWQDHFYPEIVDPKTGAVLTSDSRGQQTAPPVKFSDSAGIGLVEVGNDDLLHLHHRLHGAVGFLAIGIAQVAAERGGDD